MVRTCVRCMKVRNTEIEIYRMLQDVYSDCNVGEYILRDFAEELDFEVFAYECPLDEIMSLAFWFEDRMRLTGAELEIGRGDLVYGRIVDLLEVNEDNVRRMYNSFLSSRNLKVFFMLMDDCDKYLTDAERDKVLSIAKETFIRAVWERYE